MKWNYLFSVLLISILYSCANMEPLTGGEKDESPPTPTTAVPPNYSTNFKNRDIIIFFDEYIQVNDLNSQLLISPPLGEKPDVTVKRKSVHIRLKSILNENTTYTINFGNSILDVNENNKLQQFRYTFTTGNILDSMLLKGTVRKSFELEPEKSALIALYRNKDSILTSRPDYVGRADDNGSFTIDHLPVDSFYLLSYLDENNNLKYDKLERIGFYGEKIHTSDSNFKSLKTFTAHLYPKGKLLDTFSDAIGVYKFVVYEKEKYPIIKLKTDKKYYEIISKNQNVDTIKFISNEIADSLEFSLTYKDSSSTFWLKALKAAKHTAFTSTIIPPRTADDTLFIQFSLPLLNRIADTIKLFEDTNLVEFNSAFTSKNNDRFFIYYPWKENTSYRLTIKDSTFFDIFNQASKQENYSLRFKSKEETGTITIDYNAGSGDTLFIAQLLKEDKIVYTHKITSSGKYLYSFLEPGTYKIKIIGDLNRNGMHDVGDLLQNTQPEPVTLIKKALSIKANWDLEESFRIQFTD